MSIKYFQALGQFKNINQILEPDWQDADDDNENENEDTDNDGKISTIDDLPYPGDFCEDFIGR